MTPHIEAKKEDIAKIVLMPGDPLRAKMIADKYLKDVKLVNKVRNMLAYTGYYNNIKITVFASGMGIPSVGIYAYELYKFYDVEKIIRIGTCGAIAENLNLLDTILVSSAYSNSTFAYMFNGNQEKEFYSSESINNSILSEAKKQNIKLNIGRVITSDVFDIYVDHKEYMKKYPSELKFLASEMECFALFFFAKLFNKEAGCMLTVVDSHKNSKNISSTDRENSLLTMIELALKSL